jgi:hypothetical protein
MVGFGVGGVLLMYSSVLAVLKLQFILSNFD